MSEALDHSGCERAPLLGHNLVRLVYLDEAGVDWKSPVFCVSGVLVHGDKEWPEVDRRIIAVINRYIPEQDRDGFVFHATDIFHGSKYFDRRKPEWESRNLRFPILADLAAIIDHMHLPVVLGTYERKSFAVGVIPESDQALKADVMHTASVSDCLIRADQWLARYAPEELATVIHEDGVKAKALIKKVVRLLRNTNKLDHSGPQGVKESLGLPLKRIIDTVHFAEKADARPLQLADLCAFVAGRALKGVEVPDIIWRPIFRHVQWILGIQPPARVPAENASVGEE